jgi:hypothetical protein
MQRHRKEKKKERKEGRVGWRSRPRAEGNIKQDSKYLYVASYGYCLTFPYKLKWNFP